MLKFLITLLNFIIRRLSAEADKLDSKASRQTQAINTLIAQRMATLEKSSKAHAIADNVRKFTE